MGTIRINSLPTEEPTEGPTEEPTEVPTEEPERGAEADLDTQEEMASDLRQCNNLF